MSLVPVRVIGSTAPPGQSGDQVISARLLSDMAGTVPGPTRLIPNRQVMRRSRTVISSDPRSSLCARSYQSVPCGQFQDSTSTHEPLSSICRLRAEKTHLRCRNRTRQKLPQIVLCQSGPIPKAEHRGWLDVISSSQLTICSFVRPRITVTTVPDRSLTITRTPIAAALKTVVLTALPDAPVRSAREPHVDHVVTQLLAILPARSRGRRRARNRHQRYQPATRPHWIFLQDSRSAFQACFFETRAPDLEHTVAVPIQDSDRGSARDRRSCTGSKRVTSKSIIMRRRSKTRCTAHCSAPPIARRAQDSVTAQPARAARRSKRCLSPSGSARRR